MKRILFTVFALTCALAFSACGGGGGGSINTDPPPPTITVSVTPQTASVTAGGTKQFSASVSGSSNTAVAWTMNASASNLPEEDPGKLDSNGNYTAPSFAEGTFTVTVTAASAADSSASASATITVNPPSSQPSLVWMQTPGAADLLLNPSIFLTSDAQGNLFFSAGTKGIMTAWKIDGQTGKTDATYQATDNLVPSAVASDGTNFYVLEDGTEPPTLLSLDGNFAKRYETTECGSDIWTSAIKWDPASKKLYLALGSKEGQPFIVSADTSTGKFPCSGIVANPTVNAVVSSIGVGSDGTLTSFGFFPGDQSVCYSGMEGYLSQYGTPGWLTPFSEIAPNTLAYETSSLEVTENGKDYIYVAGSYTTCNFNDLLWVAKYDAATGAQLWNQSWDGGNTNQGAGVGGVPTLLPLPGGGVAVVAAMTPVGVVPPLNGHFRSDLIFVAYDPSGNELVPPAHVPVDADTDFISFGAALSPDGKSFYVGGILYGTAQAAIFKFTLPAILAGN